MTRSTIPVVVPKNGAVLVRRTAPVDLGFLQAMSEGVQSAARGQEAAGEDVDDVEMSTVTGPYDWRAYIAEELAIAKHRILAREVDFE